MTEVDLYHSWRTSPGPNDQSWREEMAELVKAYIRGEPIFVRFGGRSEARRAGSIARLYIDVEDMQDILHGQVRYTNHYYRYNQNPRAHIEVKEENVNPDHFLSVGISGYVKWDGRKNRIDVSNGFDIVWLKDRKAEEGTHWVWSKPEDPPAVIPQDKLGRDIKVGDFISYILYHFDNKHNAAGIYYGKVSKIENDGTVHAKNIKLKDDDRVDEKRIKDNSLIVIMSKDLMDKLMLARLSIL